MKKLTDMGQVRFRNHTARTRNGMRCIVSLEIMLTSLNGLGQPLVAWIPVSRASKLLTWESLSLTHTIAITRPGYSVDSDYYCRPILKSLRKTLNYRLSNGLIASDVKRAQEILDFHHWLAGISKKSRKTVKRKSANLGYEGHQLSLYLS